MVPSFHSHLSSKTVTAQPPADGPNPTSTSRGFYQGVMPSQPTPGAPSQGPASEASRPASKRLYQEFWNTDDPW